MNSYPPELLVQLAPTMFVAGLNPLRPPHADGTHASATHEPTEIAAGRRQSDAFTLLAQRLRDVLLDQRKATVWQPGLGKVFQVVLVDKNVSFPPRKLHPHDDPTQTAHSPLSPLMPSSPLYPDGLMAPIWVRKHTALVPAVFVLFLRLFEYAAPTSPDADRSIDSPLDVPEAPADAAARERRDGERHEEERRHDTELSREIAERKRRTGERGMKLTVVLLASRRMLDDPALDARLTYIRRTSGLDSRAALFVLSPISQAELHEFVNSLQEALYEPAIEYYAAHSKRVRRKRNRHAQTSAAYQQIYNASGGGVGPGASPPRAMPLRPEGWTVRYEYKMACFAEFRGEEEVALKHYQDSYTTLLTMFGSPLVLIPRTKRWAEAKVLADCINVKICKLFLYNGEYSLGVSQLNTHLRRFADLSSRIWGIGENTFEYWSWVARQYRVFAELLEQGTHGTLRIPSHLPTPPALSSLTLGASLTLSQMQVQSPSQISASGTPQAQEYDALRALGLNPSTALMHPGFYYYIAAACTERRREMFLIALQEEEEHGVASQAPGYVNEKKVDHMGSILELYTKSYELFKKYSSTPPSAPQTPPAVPATPGPGQGQGRFTLWIAYRIAQTYVAAGKYDMAVRFFERIARTYRRERWTAMLRPLLSVWHSCAQKMGDVELSVRLLVEIMASGGCVEDGSPDDKESVVEDLLAILKSTVPSSPDNVIVVELSESEPILNSIVTFWQPNVEIDEPAAFQIHLSAADINLKKLPISTLKITLADDLPPVVVNNKYSADWSEAAPSVIHVDLGSLQVHTEVGEERQVNAALSFARDNVVVLCGTLATDTAQELTISKGSLTISENGWNIELPFELGEAHAGTSLYPRWLSSMDPPTFIPVRRASASHVTVKVRPHQLEIVITHDAPAYLDERYPISVSVTNVDNRDLDVVADVLLQPGEDDSENHIEFADQQSTGLIKGVSFGILRPGVSATKTLYLTSTGTAGERLVDFSIQTRLASSRSPTSGPTSPVSPGSPTSPPASADDTAETLHTLEVPVTAAFSVTQDVAYRQREGMAPGVGSLETFEGDYWDDAAGGEARVVTIMECASEGEIVVEGMRLVQKDAQSSKALRCSVDEEEFPAEILPGDQYCLICELSLAPPEDFFSNSDEDIPEPAAYEITWRRSSFASDNAPTVTKISLPRLRPPSSTLVALLQMAPHAILHEPTTLTLLLRNNHPTRTACPQVSLDLDPPPNVTNPTSPTQPTESFVVAGVRSARAPTLLPGAETRLVWVLIPIACGPAVPLPRVRVVDRRDAEAAAARAEAAGAGVGAGLEGGAGDTEQEVEVKVVDVRDWKSSGNDAAGEETQRRRPTIVVAPA